MKVQQFPLYSCSPGSQVDVEVGPVTILVGMLELVERLIFGVQQ